MLSQAIPAYRLPEEDLERDLARLANMPIDIRTNAVIEPKDMDRLMADFEAVFVAIGAGEPLRPNLPGIEAEGVMTGLDFLTAVRQGRIKKRDGRVIVVGGGNVAVDAAMSALRLGAAEVEMVSLEEKGRLPAHENELAEAMAEGVRLTTGWGPVKVIAAKGRVEGAEFVRCTSVFNESGGFEPVFDPSQTMTRPAHGLILAVGQKSRVDILIGADQADNGASEPGDPGSLGTVKPGLYMGGDAWTGPASVALSMAAGKKAAAVIHLDLTGRSESLADALLGQGPAFSITALFSGREGWEPGKVVGFEEIDPVFLDHRSPEPIPRLEPEQRKRSFIPLEPGLDAAQAISEAQRCFNCGTCVDCQSWPGLLP